MSNVCRYDEYVEVPGAKIKKPVFVGGDVTTVELCLLKTLRSVHTCFLLPTISFFFHGATASSLSKLHDHTHHTTLCRTLDL